MCWNHLFANVAAKEIHPNCRKNYNWNSCFYETLGSEICLCARPVTIYHVCWIGSKLLICCWTCLSGTDKHQALSNCCMLLHEMDSSIKSTSAFRVHNDQLNQCIITKMSRVWSWLQQSAIGCWKKSKIYFVFLYFAWRSIQTTCTIFTPLETKLKPMQLFSISSCNLLVFYFSFLLVLISFALIGWYVVYLYNLQYSAEMCIFSNFHFCFA